MLNAYGPWATSLDAGSRPQLSAFWRRRLRMLVPTSQASLAISRRNRLWLIAAAVLMLAVPTIRPVLAEEPDTGMYFVFDNQSDTEKSDEKASPEAKPESNNVSVVFSSGEYSVSYIVGTGVVPNNYRPLPLFLSTALGDERTRQFLKLTPDQEGKLREISAQFRKRMQEVYGKPEELLKLSPEEQEAKQAGYEAKQDEVQKDVRKQVEAILTAEQWTAAKNIAVGSMQGATRLASEEKLRETLGITEEQQKELARLGEKSQAEHQALETASRETDQQLLAVIQPEQWQQIGSIEQLSGDPNAEAVLLMRAISAPENELRPQWKEIVLTDEQKSKLKDMQAKMDARIGELQKPLEGLDFSKQVKEVEAKLAEYRAKTEEAQKQFYDQAKGVLTERQLPILKKLTAQYLFLQHMLSFRGLEKDGEKPSDILEQLKVTDQQKKQLGQLCQQRDRRRIQLDQQIGEAAMGILTSQQVEKIVDNPLMTMVSMEWRQK